MKEIWKNIKGYEGLYQVSNLGRIKSLVSNKILKQTTSMRYTYVTLCVNYARKHLLVHRIVASHFLPNEKGLPCVNHKNLNKYDNRVENLEWCTHTENNNHAIQMKGRKRNKVIQYSLNNKYIKTWKTIKEASVSLKIPSSTIYACCRKVILHAGDYKWKYSKK